MSGPQHTGHIEQKHVQGSQPLTADDLNKRSLGHAFEAPDEKTRMDSERRYYGAIKSGQNAADLPDIAVGRATYSFTVGDAGVPHVYTAEVTADGKIAHEKVFYMRDSKHIVETKVGPNVTAQFEQFALADISNARKTSIEPYVQVHADLSRANNQPRWKQLGEASTKDVQNMLQQQRMARKPQDPSGGLGGIY